MLRIAHVATVDVTLKSLLRPQVTYLLSRGYDVEMIASPGPHTSKLRQDGFVVHNVSISRRIAPAADLISLFRLARLFRRRRYDLVHTHTSKAGFLGRLAARLAGVPMAVHTAHGFFFHENMPSWKRRIFEGVEWLAGRWTDLLFLQSAEDYEYVLRVRLVPPERARQLGNGIDLAVFNPDRWGRPEAIQAMRRQLFGSQDYFFVLMVASMIERKGHIHLLRALERMKERAGRLRVALVGAGPLLPSLREMMRAAGLEEMVVFLGYREDVPQLMAAADVYVLPSLSEGMPRSIIEAMALQCPVIASDIRGSRELVVHEETGLLVPPGDEEGLARALCQLMDDPDLRRRMGEAGRRRAASNFDEREVFGRLEAGYRALFQARGYANGGQGGWRGPM